MKNYYDKWWKPNVTEASSALSSALKDFSRLHDSVIKGPPDDKYLKIQKRWLVYSVNSLSKHTHTHMLPSGNLT